MIPRYGPRVSFTGSVNLIGESGPGSDVRKRSCCQAVFSSIRMHSGPVTMLILRLFLPGRAYPMTIPLAVVRWVKETLAGLESIRSSEDIQTRLTGFVQNRNSSRDLSLKYL